MVIINLIQITASIRYGQHPDHRNNTRKKSQWIISNNEETQCFRRTNLKKNKWFLNNAGWGLHLNQGTAVNLGVAQDHKTLVFFAKFVTAHGTGNWHGYPADHQKNHADIPPNFIAKVWITRKYLKRAKVRKLLLGQPCKI